ncbi:tetratricopeptide repeat protein [Kingella negevensis]|nr:tetratricopeptide repeat protein [Kingella negevensis]MDK4683349.1 tetratricopeptide repeat protein [Kingella negevensis]
MSHLHLNEKNRKLCVDIFKFAAWDLHKRENQNRVDDLIFQAAQNGLLDQAQTYKNLGIRAFKYETELKNLFNTNPNDAQNYHDELLNNADIHEQIKHHIKIAYKKLIQAADNTKNKSYSQNCTVNPPVLSPHHPNSLRHLAAHHAWDIVIDETGREFEDVDNLSINAPELGRFVALAVPHSVTLKQLPSDFHAVSAEADLLDNIVNDILSKPVGVLGITANDPLSLYRPRWFSGVYDLLKLALRLLPLPENGKKQVHIYIENRHSFNEQSDFQVLKQLLLSELQSIDEERFSNFNLSIQIVTKGGHAYLPHVDALAHCWGGSSAKTRLKLAKFKGHCFLTHNSGAMERIYAAFDGKSALSAADWFQAACLLHDEPESLLVDCMQRLGEMCRKDVKLWQKYLQEIQYHLNQKTYHAQQLDKVIAWLEKYRPQEKHLPALLQLRFQAAQLAADNHMGRMNLSAIQPLLQLGKTLQIEAATEVAQVYSRLAVAATNVFEFDSAKNLITHALSVGEMAVGRLQFARLQSGLGQIYAFEHKYDLANQHFNQALNLFDLLSDQEAAKKDKTQTQIYQIHQYLDAGANWQTIKPFVDAVCGNDLNKAALRFAQYGQDNKRFEHHVFLRVMANYGDECQAARDIYLNNMTNWYQGTGHPWQLIDLWRGWLLHFSGS